MAAPPMWMALVACTADPATVDSGSADPWPTVAPVTGPEPSGAASLCEVESGIQALTTVQVQPDPTVFGRQVVDVTLAWPGHVQALCTSETEPLDQLWAESEQPAAEHALVFGGLHPTQSYSCQVTPVCPGVAAAPWDFQLLPASNILQGLPQPSIERHAERAMIGAYTLISTYSAQGFSGTSLVLLDPEGAIRWTHDLGDAGVDTEVQWHDGHVVFGGGGFTGQPTVGIVDLDGHTLYAAPPWDTTWDHHVAMLDDGTLFGLALDSAALGPQLHSGFKLVHWDPATDDILWEWRSIDAVTAGTLPIDYAHSNWATLVDGPDGAAAYASLCELQLLIRIDVATGELVWTLGVGGDFTLLDGDGQALPDDQLPQCQHGVDVEGDRWLMMDNGREREQSRALALTIDQDARTATLDWEWTRDDWFNDILGEADFLGDDHRLVVNGVAHGMGTRPWIAEVHAPTGEIVWQANFSNRDWIYRVERIDGCDAFQNARYCPGLVDGLRGGAVLP